MAIYIKNAGEWKSVTGSTLDNVGSANQVLYKNSLNAPTTSPNFTFDGSNVSVTGQIKSTQANSTTMGGGQIYLNGPTGNRIDFNRNGSGPPIYGTRSLGTKILLWNTGVPNNQTDFAIGIDGNDFWNSVPTSGQYFKFYAGTYQAATITGTGIVESAVGWRCRPGAGGVTLGNVFNIHWTGSAAQLWIDDSYIGTFEFINSDYRIKKNIQTQTSPAIERITKLNPITYEYNDYGEVFKGDGVKREGFIAHELAEVIPSAVNGEKDDPNQIQSLRLDALVSVLTKALQEAVERIETLEQEVAELKNK